MRSTQLTANRPWRAAAARSCSAPAAVLDRAVQQFGGVDVLVNNAGYGLTGALEETILTEVVANSLDSGATCLRLTADPASLTLTIVVVFVFDFADDLFHHILNGDQTVDAAVFVHDQSHVRALHAHFEQQVEHTDGR